MSRRWTAAVCLVVLACGAGCTPSFDALTTPPPFTTAELCDGDDACGGEDTIKLTRGIALAFECNSVHGNPCTNAHAVVADPDVAAVFDGYADTLSPVQPSEQPGVAVGAQPRATFVVLGRLPGLTTLSVTSDDGDETFDVTVEPPP